MLFKGCDAFKVRSICQRKKKKILEIFKNKTTLYSADGAEQPASHVRKHFVCLWKRNVKASFSFYVSRDLRRTRRRVDSVGTAGWTERELCSADLLSAKCLHNGGGVKLQTAGKGVTL